MVGVAKGELLGADVPAPDRTAVGAECRRPQLEIENTKGIRPHTPTMLIRGALVPTERRVVEARRCRSLSTQPWETVDFPRSGFPSRSGSYHRGGAARDGNGGAKQR